MEVQLIHFQTIDSTNAYAKQHAKEFDPKKLTCITADVQTAGKGRFNRTWVSKKGNLHMTLFLVLEKNTPLIINLAQILTYSAAKALKNVPLQIKWPNDLLGNGKKFCGAMVETVELETGLGVVMGLGMDVNTEVHSDQETTSLFEMTKKNWDLKKLRDEIIDSFLIYIHKNFSEIKDDFEKLLAYKGEKIVIHTPQKQLIGTLDSLTENGLLKIKFVDGTMTKILSGEINKLRGL